LEVETVLRGSLDTFALPDVLTLLAGTAKSGELQVTGSAGDGRVWLDRGQIVGAESGAARDPVSAVVQLLRLEEGEFEFEADVDAPDPAPGVPVEQLLAAAAEQLAEWREIEAILPSPAAMLELAPQAPKGGVRVTADQWRAIVAVGEGRPVEDVVVALGGDELAASRVVKGLVEAGLVAVEAEDDGPGHLEADEDEPYEDDPIDEAPETIPAPPARPSAPPAPRSDLVRHLSSLSVPPAAAGEADEAVAEEAEMAEEDAPEAAPAVAQASTTTTEPVNRGTLLKFLSSVRT
jgi:hypothetical protein